MDWFYWAVVFGLRWCLSLPSLWRHILIIFFNSFDVFWLWRPSRERQDSAPRERQDLQLLDRRSISSILAGIISLLPASNGSHQCCSASRRYFRFDFLTIALNTLQVINILCLFPSIVATKRTCLKLWLARLRRLIHTLSQLLYLIRTHVMGLTRVKEYFSVDFLVITFISTQSDQTFLIY